jgi:hypothetical protein
MSYILSQIRNTIKTLVFFDMPRNATVQQERLSAVLVRTSGLYYNAEIFNLKFMNRIPISRPNLKVSSITTQSKKTSNNFHTPFLMRK